MWIRSRKGVSIQWAVLLLNLPFSCTQSALPLPHPLHILPTTCHSTPSLPNPEQDYQHQWASSVHLFTAPVACCLWQGSAFWQHCICSCKVCYAYRMYISLASCGHRIGTTICQWPLPVVLVAWGQSELQLSLMEDLPVKRTRFPWHFNQGVCDKFHVLWGELL